jgi:hypothetical protein
MEGTGRSDQATLRGKRIDKAILEYTEPFLLQENGCERAKQLQ